MMFENNFVVVAEGVLVDPVLKLRLSLGRWEPGYTGPIAATQDLELYHDPEIRADRMTMPIPEDRRRRQLLLGPIVNDWQVFESDQSRKILSMVLNIIREGNQAKLLVTAGKHGLRLEASLLQDKLSHEFGSHPHEIIRYALESCLMMPSWDMTEGRVGKRASIGLYVDRPLADEWATCTAFNFDRSFDGPVLVVSRELQP